MYCGWLLDVLCDSYISLWFVLLVLLGYCLVFTV